MPRLRIYGPLRPRLTMGPVQRNPAAAARVRPADQRAGAGRRRSTTSPAASCAGTCGAGSACCCSPSPRPPGRLPADARRAARPQPGGRGRRAARRRRDLAPPSRRDRPDDRASPSRSRRWPGSRRGRPGLHRDGARAAEVGSLTDLVGSSSVSPEPAGPAVTGFTGAVIGDSRAVRVGGPPVPDPRPADAACGAAPTPSPAEVGACSTTPVLNLACPSATTAAGLLGPAGAGRGCSCRRRSACSSRCRGCGSSPSRSGRTTWAGPTCSPTATRSRTARTTSAGASSTTGSPPSTATTAPCSPSWPRCPGSRRSSIVTSYDALPATAGPGLRGPARARPGAAGLTDGRGRAARRPQRRAQRDPRRGRAEVRLRRRPPAPGAAVPDGRGARGRPRRPPARPTRRRSPTRPGGGPSTADTAPRDRPAPSAGPLAAPPPPAGTIGPDLQGLADPFPFHPTGAGSLRTAAAVAASSRPAPTATDDRTHGRSRGPRRRRRRTAACPIRDRPWPPTHGRRVARWAPASGWGPRDHAQYARSRPHRGAPPRRDPGSRCGAGPRLSAAAAAPSNP